MTNGFPDTSRRKDGWGASPSVRSTRYSTRFYAGISLYDEGRPGKHEPMIPRFENTSAAGTSRHHAVQNLEVHHFAFTGGRSGAPVDFNHRRAEVKPSGRRLHLLPLYAASKRGRCTQRPVRSEVIGAPLLPAANHPLPEYIEQLVIQWLDGSQSGCHHKRKRRLRVRKAVAQVQKELKLLLICAFESDRDAEFMRKPHPPATRASPA